MPLRDVAAMNTSLDNDYDAMDVEVALFVGDPNNGGVEVTDGDCPGYVRVVSPDSEREPAAAGRKRICLAVFTADSAWVLEPTHYQLFDAADSVTGWDNAPLDVALEVTAAGDVSVFIDVFYDDSVPTA